MRAPVVIAAASVATLLWSVAYLFAGVASPPEGGTVWWAQGWGIALVVLGGPLASVGATLGLRSPRTAASLAAAGVNAVVLLFFLYLWSGSLWQLWEWLLTRA